MKLRLTMVPILALLCCAALIHAQPANKEHWVATWATAQPLAVSAGRGGGRGGPTSAPGPIAQTQQGAPAQPGADWLLTMGDGY